MRIIVPSAPVREVNYTKEGQAKKLRFQPVALQSDDAPFPLPFELSLGPNTAPYAPGDYTFSSSSFKLEKGRLVIDGFNIKLVPLSSDAH